MEKKAHAMPLYAIFKKVYLCLSFRVNSLSAKKVVSAVMLISTKMLTARRPTLMYRSILVLKMVS